jgi:hypothetical protein
METEQLIFEEVVLEAEDRHRAAQDELRQDVQDWFDALPSRVKDVLGAWVDGSTQYDALVALSAGRRLQSKANGNAAAHVHEEQRG